LKFNWSRKKWTWDTARLRAASLSDNVLDFMVSQIKKLSPESQRVLSLAACIGDKFDISLLAQLYDKKVSDTAADLWEALNASYIVPMGMYLCC
jgi:predicted ATPase